MDHSAHHAMGHGDQSAEAMCKMYMLWNTNIINTCIVFREWHIQSTSGFIFSLFVIGLIGVGYEWIRDLQRKLDVRIAARMIQTRRAAGASSSSGIDTPGEDALLLGRARGSSRLSLDVRVLRAALYGLSVFISFFLMLVFMTYNAYLIGATVVGAIAGHYIFNQEIDPEAVLAGAGGNKGMACH